MTLFNTENHQYIIMIISYLQIRTINISKEEDKIEGKKEKRRGGTVLPGCRVGVGKTGRI